MNLCAAAAPIITGTSACFALSEHSIPAAPALRISACGAMVGGSSVEGAHFSFLDSQCKSKDAHGLEIAQF